MPGGCTADESPVCESAFARAMFIALRHNDETNSPVGATATTSVLTEPLPMWMVRDWRLAIKNIVISWQKLGMQLEAKFKDQGGITVEIQKKIATSVLEKMRQTFAESAGYLHFLKVVVPAAIDEMLAVNGDPEALLNLDANVKGVSSPAHFIRGFMRAKHIPGYPVGSDTEEAAAFEAAAAAKCKAEADAAT